MKPVSHINPTKARVQEGRTKAFAASITFMAGARLKYPWNTTGRYGDQGDCGSNERTDFTTDRATVTYRANPTMPDNVHDEVKIEVIWVADDDSERPLGEATAGATLQEDTVCGELNTDPYTSGFGNFTLSSSSVNARDGGRASLGRST